MTIDIETTTIGELALARPNAIGIMEKWRIDYCCQGHRSIAAACKSAGVPAGDLLIAIGEPREERTPDWQSHSLADLQNYIIETHHAYTRQALETNSLLAEKVAARHGANHAEVVIVERLVGALVGDLMPHMMKEEQILFPYVEELEAAGPDDPAPQSCFGTIANPIRAMMMEHDAVGEIMAQLRGATGGYALPGDACLSFRALYERLADLEQDLHRHIHLENDLLFPRAVRLEDRR